MPGYTFNEAIFHGVIFGISYLSFDWFLGTKPIPQPKDSFMDLADFLYEKIKNREEEFSQCEEKLSQCEEELSQCKEKLSQCKAAVN